MTYRDRRERRAERRDEWAESRRTKEASAFGGAQRLADAIPLGQPILVGHHSEKRARRDQERIHNGMMRGIEHGKMAAHHAGAAGTIRDQLDRSVYRDDDDAVERLEEKIAGLETKRDRMNTINDWLTKQSGVPRRRVPRGVGEEVERRAAKALARCFRELELTDAERKDCLITLQMNCLIGYPPYALSNIGATLRKEHKRLTEARERRAQTDRARATLAAEYAAESD